MKPNTSLLILAGLLAATAKVPASVARSISLSPIGTYASGQIGVSAAEIVAHDPATQRLFVVNALSAEIDVISIANPTAPEKFGSISLKAFGAGANSVAVREGIIAVAVEADKKTDPGSVVFFDGNLNFLSSVKVGALPDMLTFTPNGRFVLVANEGEPNSAYTIDPEGSVSIINLAGGAKKLTQSSVRTADFKKFNNVALNPAIRVFGPNATVAQDMEPEYITVSHDSKTAWVVCQENNAFAIIDINSATVKELVPLGFKDHAAVAAGASLYNFDASQLPSIGTTLAGQEIPLGGFSGLAFEGIDPATGRHKFVAHTDRGPNAEPTGILRPFLLPGFAPEVVRFEWDSNSGAITLTQRIALQSAPGVPLTGLPNTAISSSASAPYNDEVPVDLLGNTLPLDPLGGDFEGIVIDPADGSMWMCDEYRPAIYHFDAAGVLIQRYVPLGTAAAAGAAPGTFGVEALPPVIAQRRQNRGFEAIALDNGRIYAFVQSPLRNPSTLANSALNGMRNIRIVEFNPATLATRQFLYVMDNPNLGGEPNSRADKIGDAVSLGNGEFLVIERDDDKISTDPASTIEKKVYQINLSGATALNTAQSNGLIGTTGKSVDQLSGAELAANGIRPVYKQLYVDLVAAGYDQVEKVEGLAVIDPWTIAVINDNDFGVADITVAPDGSFTRNYTPEPVQLGIIDVRHNALDASDRDTKINIRPWPVKGVYMPDAIASYQVKGKTYIITANEGDAREYIVTDPVTGVETPSFVENVRIGSSSVVLDPVKFPNAAVLKNNANLGRLNITNTLGKNPATGFYEELYAFGARSFSIWDASGSLVWDSGDDLERITAAKYPLNFNTSNSNNEFDNRSDDKGPEPEGVVVGKVFGRDYAFIGLERIGGVVVYDVSNPELPIFTTYVNNRDFTKEIGSSGSGDSGVEGLLFIKPEDSPNGKPLLVTGNEVSGTTTVFEISN